MIRKCIAEAVGTFAMVFAGTGAMMVDSLTGEITHAGVAITWGLVVMSMIYALGDVSGAHFNPAVTAAFFAAGRLPGRTVIPYWISQLVGALLASAVLRLALGNVAALGATFPKGSDPQSFVFEFVLTLILMFVILCVSSGSKETGLMAGIAVGGVIGFEAMFGGPVCEASMNPWRSLAPAIVGNQYHSLWIYLTAPFLGAMAAVPLWQLTRADVQPIKETT